MILAAGMGKRLKEHTANQTKCMVKVNGVPLIDRMLRQLDQLNLSRVVIVTGFEGEGLRNHIDTLLINTPIEFVHNDVYDKTNNIYSLFLARDWLLKEDTVLLESDLIFEDRALSKLLSNPYPSLALVAKYESWMDGTVVKIDEDNHIVKFLDKSQFRFKDIKSYYKTVNIYKFSKDFSTTHYVPFLQAYSKALGNNEYYEQVLRVITLLDTPSIKAATIDDVKWYEIDDKQDLDIANSVFGVSPQERFEKINSRYGGFWRYPYLIDYCYLVNPFYPGKRLLGEIKANFNRLITEYPSGQRINSLLTAKYYGVKEEFVCIGNGAAEIISSLLRYFDGKFGVIYPTFEEYPNRLHKEQIVPFFASENSGYRYSADELIAFYSENPISALILINPDNPSGNFLNRNEIEKLLVWTKLSNISLILDESFIDFSLDFEEDSFLRENDLTENKHLILIKSISKSFGVPGIRLGFAATSDESIIKYLRKDVTIWNINSFGEFYLQIFEKYKDTYYDGLATFKAEKERFIKCLSDVSYLSVLPSQANFVMCKVNEGIDAHDLAVWLLDKSDILIKNISTKPGVSGQYIRLAIRNKSDNDKLVKSLMKYQS